MNGIPRRAQMQQWCQAEQAIHDAVVAVEVMPPHPRLTDAVVLLGHAKDAVADYVDSSEGIPMAEKRSLRGRTEMKITKDTVLEALNDYFGRCFAPGCAPRITNVTQCLASGYTATDFFEVMAEEPKPPEAPPAEVDGR